MTTFYVSPSSLTYKQYHSVIKVCLSFGWCPKYIWPRESFYPDSIIKQQILKKAVKGIGNADIFIAYVPGNCSTFLEIGLAYNLCEEVFLFARDQVYFTQTGLADAHIATLPDIKRVCCDIDEIPVMLEQEYSYLIDISKHLP